MSRDPNEHTGPHRLLGGRASWGYAGGLSILIVALPKISNADWLQLLEENHAVGAGAGFAPTVSISHFLHDALDAGQRKLTVDFLKRTGLVPIARTVALTDSAMTRGAMTALAWFLPGWTFRAHAPRHYKKGLEWLREHTPFPMEPAERMLEGCYEAVGARPPSAFG